MPDEPIDIVTNSQLPEKLNTLYEGEEHIRAKTIESIAADHRAILHLRMVEVAMDCADQYRQYETDDEDIKVLQILGIRIFNAFASSLKLSLSGYHQNGALILRDILETVFLLDFFRTDPSKIKSWRLTPDEKRNESFGPVKIRVALDHRDGFTEKKRHALYKLLSELAGHPTMKSHYMLRPKSNMDALIGPFMDQATQKAVLEEMSKLAIQAGEHICSLLPIEWPRTNLVRQCFNKQKAIWTSEFILMPAIK